MKIRLTIGAMIALALGFSFSAGLHYHKWLHIDSNHVIVGIHDHYVDLWHGNGDGGINVRIDDRTCTGNSISQGFYIDRDC